MSDTESRINADAAVRAYNASRIGMLGDYFGQTSTFDEYASPHRPARLNSILCPTSLEFRGLPATAQDVEAYGMEHLYGIDAKELEAWANGEGDPNAFRIDFTRLYESTANVMPCKCGEVWRIKVCANENDTLHCAKCGSTTPPKYKYVYVPVRFPAYTLDGIQRGEHTWRLPGPRYDLSWFEKAYGVQPGERPVYKVTATQGKTYPYQRETTFGRSDVDYIMRTESLKPWGWKPRAACKECGCCAYVTNADSVYCVRCGNAQARSGWDDSKADGPLVASECLALFPWFTKDKTSTEDSKG